MPKPVLSDSLFNADDVATAVLQEANLQVANSDLGVVDRTSLFSVNSTDYQNIDTEAFGAYSFNGFMFVNFRLRSVASSVPSNEVMFTITDSDFYPNQLTTMPTISYQGDSANYVEFKTNGQVAVSAGQNTGGGNQFYIVFNGIYRFA